MGRAPCCEKVGLKRGRWTDEEDGKLRKYIEENGEGSWRSLPKNAGLLRCGKSCRLRWINYLRTDLKRGSISSQEEEIIINLHASMGNRWSLIAAHLPGRTDNEIKNYWNSHLSRKIDSYRRPNPNFIPPPPPSKSGGGRKKKIKNNNKNKNKGEAEGNKEANGSVLMPATPTPERETITKSSSGNEERESGMLAGGGECQWYDQLVVDGDGDSMEDLSGLWDPGLEIISEDQLSGRNGEPAFEEEDTFSWFWDDNEWNSDDPQKKDKEIDDAMLSWLLS